MLTQLVAVLFLASVSVNSYVVNPKSIADLSSQEETTVFVNNTESLVRALNSYGSRLLIVYIARLVDNQYTYLFSMNYERLVELLKPLDVVHLMVGVGITEESVLLREVLEKIPDNSMFVLDGEPMQYCVCSLASLRNLMGHPPPVIIHTEQEMPWIDEENDIFAGRFVNGTNCHNSDIALIYHSYKHIFRTYYYRPLVDIAHVTYLPLGPAATSYTQQFSESHPMLKASERTFWCMFTGRIEYGFRSKHHYNRGDLEFTLEHLKNTVGWEDDHRRCSMLYGQTDQNRHVMNHDDYHLLLSQTAFIPCPSGNSPETFRHYEVMALGGIPLIVKSTEYPDEDFLIEWNGFPGPIFDSWYDAMEFTSDISSSDADQLQLAIHMWYIQWNIDRKVKVFTTLKGLFESLVK